MLGIVAVVPLKIRTRENPAPVFGQGRLEIIGIINEIIIRQTEKDHSHEVLYWLASLFHAFLLRVGLHTP